MKPYNELLKIRNLTLAKWAKTVLDALNGIAYKDDKQVCELNITKDYSDTGYDYIKVRIKNVVGSIDDAKYDFLYDKLMEKKNQLQKKEKLTKKQKDQLEEIERKLKEMNLLPF